MFHWFSKKTRARPATRCRSRLETLEPRLPLDGAAPAVLVGPAIAGTEQPSFSLAPPAPAQDDAPAQAAQVPWDQSPLYAAAGLTPEGEGDMPPFATGIETVDIDGNGQVTVNDALLIVRYLREHGASVFDVFAGEGWEDANGDGWVTVADILVVVRFLRLNGTGTAPPAPAQTNLSPFGTSMSLTVTETGSISFVPAIFDFENDPLTFAVTEQPENGTLTVAQDGRTYAYHAETFGLDSFVITGTDAQGRSASSVVSVTVELGPGMHALPDRITVPKDTPVEFSPLVNDRHSGGIPFGIVSHTGTSNGVLTHKGGGIFEYIPNAAFAGTDAFTYTIEDDTGAQKTATVTLVVRANGTPTPSFPSLDVHQDTPSAELTVEDLASDDDGDRLTITFGQPGNGVIEPTENGWRYIPNVGFTGTDTVTYTVADGFGPSTEGTLTITVTPARFTGPTVNRAEVVYVIAERSPGGPTISGQRYSDVGSTHWAYASVEETHMKGFLDDGFAVGPMFFPARAVTYGELADILVQAYDLPGPDVFSAAQAAGVLLPGDRDRLAEHVPEARFWQMVAAAEHGDADTLSDSQRDTLGRELAAEFGDTY